MFRPLTLILLCCASACTSFVPSTLGRVAGLSPLTADPAAIALRVALPDGVGIAPGSARMILSSTDGAITTTDVFVLEQMGDVYAIAAADIGPLQSRQAELSAIENSRGDEVSGSLGLSLTPCRIGNGPAPDANASVDLRLTSDGPFLPLIRNGPISAITEDADTSLWPDCAQ